MFRMTGSASQTMRFNILPPLPVIEVPHSMSFHPATRAKPYSEVSVAHRLELPAG